MLLLASSVSDPVREKSWIILYRTDAQSMTVWTPHIWGVQANTLARNAPSPFAAFYRFLWIVRTLFSLSFDGKKDSGCHDVHAIHRHTPLLRHWGQVS